MFKIVKRLDPEEQCNDLPVKPKGMHWRTYNRFVERYEYYDAQWASAGLGGQSWQCGGSGSNSDLLRIVQHVCWIRSGLYRHTCDTCRAGSRPGPPTSSDRSVSENVLDLSDLGSNPVRSAAVTYPALAPLAGHCCQVIDQSQLSTVAAMAHRWAAWL